MPRRDRRGEMGDDSVQAPAGGDQRRYLRNVSDGRRVFVKGREGPVEAIAIIYRHDHGISPGNWSFGASKTTRRCKCNVQLWSRAWRRPWWRCGCVQHASASDCGHWPAGSSLRPTRARATDSPSGTGQVRSTRRRPFTIATSMSRNAQHVASSRASASASAAPSGRSQSRAPPSMGPDPVANRARRSCQAPRRSVAWTGVRSQATTTSRRRILNGAIPAPYDLEPT